MAATTVLNYEWKVRYRELLELPRHCGTLPASDERMRKVHMQGI